MCSNQKRISLNLQSNFRDENVDRYYLCSMCSFQAPGLDVTE